MPVYMATLHSYGSWKEDDPNGYIQRNEGLKVPNEALARWREEHRSQGAVRFEHSSQEELQAVLAEIAQERKLRLHASATTPTHTHGIVSFRNPACQCGAGSNYCASDCLARQDMEKFITHLKRVSGYRLGKLLKITGRKWFSRGWDLTRVTDEAHLDYLLNVYLPKHVEENGIVRVYQ